MKSPTPNMNIRSKRHLFLQYLPRKEIYCVQRGYVQYINIHKLGASTIALSMTLSESCEVSIRQEQSVSKRLSYVITRNDASINLDCKIKNNF